MASAGDVIAHSLTTSKSMMHRFVDDLSPQEFLHRPAEKANCAAWLIGHLILSERGGLKTLGADLPSLPDTFEQRFSRDEGCPQAAEFGDVAQLMPLFDQHRDRLIEAVKRATPEQLDQPVPKPHPLFSTAGQLANFLAHHVTLHAGQITIIRRSLGRPPVV
jgi:uncharacterized damage-inducible protein DinB